jgi:Ca2+-binding EF-hand superfamily protein
MPKVDTIDFEKFLRALETVKAFKFEMAVDHGDTLLSKFRAHLKKLKLTVDRAYNEFDRAKFGSVQKHDFIYVCQMMDMPFNEEELEKLFESICAQCQEKTDSHD